MCPVIQAARRAGQAQPTRVIRGPENTLTVDGVDLVLLNPGPTHGSGNLAAWFAPEKVLFSSDTIIASAKYGFMPDYHFRNLITYLRDFLALGGTVLYPGATNSPTARVSRRGIEFIEAVMTACQQAFVNFVPIWAYEPMKAFCIEQLADRFRRSRGV